jgi:hypothetical protein
MSRRLTERVPHNSSFSDPRTRPSHARSDGMDAVRCPFERVFTMTDYYDGPRRGIANFGGRPHAYHSPFNRWDDEYDELYELRAIDEETFRLALEEWEIWLRWEAAYHAGAAAADSHPALGPDRPRHDELARRLEARLAALPGPAIRARAVFRPIPGQACAPRRWLEVQWTRVGPEEGLEPP